MPLTIEEAKRAIIILKGIQDKQLKEATKAYLKPIEHKVWHDAVQEQMIAMTLELDKFFKKQADILYQLIHEEEQLFVPKKGNEESVAIKKTLQAIDLIMKDDSPKKYKVWEYLDALYNRVVVDDIKDKVVEYARSFRKELEKIYSKVTKKTYEKVSQSISTDETPFEFNKSNKWVKEHIQEKAIKWSKQVAQTTEERVKRKLVKEYEKGSSVYDTAKSLKEDGAFSFSRAEKIARTEIFSSGNHVDYLSFNQNEDVIGYKWCSMEDKRVRPTHTRANGQFRKKGEPFSVGGSRLLYPGDNSLGAAAKEVICCRCYLEPVFIDDELTLEEERAVLNYVSSDSYKINEKLRDGLELDDNDLEFMYNLDSALAKMPKYQGDVRRYLEISDKDKFKQFIDEYGIANMVNDKSYFSCTCGDVYNDKANIVLYIFDSSKATDLRKYNEGEQEILYDRFAKFKVVEIDILNGVYHILLEEI